MTPSDEATRRHTIALTEAVCAGQPVTGVHRRAEDDRVVRVEGHDVMRVDEVGAVTEVRQLRGDAEPDVPRPAVP